MRVVLDTVILVRGLINPPSWCGRIVFQQTDRFRWIISPSIVDEYLDVLTRPELVRKYRTVATRDLNAILEQIATATVVHPKLVPAICRDPADDKFLAAAIAGNASFIVTEDEDLLSIGSLEEIAVVNARTFLQVLETSEPS
jgi:uncharacterized protein